MVKMRVGFMQKAISSTNRYSELDTRDWHARSTQKILLQKRGLGNHCRRIESLLVECWMLIRLIVKTKEEHKCPQNNKWLHDLFSYYMCHQLQVIHSSRIRTGI